MNPNDAWFRFVSTGKISDYLEYKNLQKDKDKNNADNNHGTGSQSNRYK